MTRDEVAKLFGTTAAKVDAAFKKGMKVGVEKFAPPGVILAVPLKVGYPIAVEFDAEVPGGSTCEGLGKPKRCRWVRPDRLVEVK
jgi:hypothetical protein